MSERRETIPENERAKIPEERGTDAWYEAQEARDGAGMLRALKHGARDRERLERGEATQDELDQEENDDLARIGLFADEQWNAMTRDEQREALRKAYGRYPVTTGSIWDE